LSAAERLTALVGEVLRLSVDRVVDSLKITETDSWDSLTHMALVAGLEEEFAIVLTGDEIIAMTSVAGIRHVLKNHGLDV
jgi:acyl carrier protein